jgi:hypothetical protein
MFCFWFFSWVSFPPAPEFPIRTILIFFENSRVASQDAPPVSTTPAANFTTSFLSVVDTGGKILQQYQAADSLKVNLTAKIYIYDNSTTQSCSNKKL